MNMADTENFSQSFGPLKQGYMLKVSFFRVVHGCNKVMLGRASKSTVWKIKMVFVVMVHFAGACVRCI